MATKAIRIKRTKEAIGNLVMAIEDLKGDGVPAAGIKPYEDRLREEQYKLALLEPKGYIVRSKVNPKLILCADGEFHSEHVVGPSGYGARVYKTRRGAKNARNGYEVIVEELP